MAAAKTAVVETVSVPEMDIHTATLVLAGISPLITHRWSEKAREDIRIKIAKGAKGGRKAKDPATEFRSAMYALPPGADGKPRFGFPALAFKKAMIDAAMTIAGEKKTVNRRAFHVLSDGLVDNQPMVEILSPTGPEMREDTVRVGMGCDLRYRPQFSEWGVRLRVRFDKDQISISQLVNLAKRAGFSCGVGEWRVEKDGISGMFDVVGVE